MVGRRILVCLVMLSALQACRQNNNFMTCCIDSQTFNARGDNDPVRESPPAMQAGMITVNGKRFFRLQAHERFHVIEVVLTQAPQPGTYALGDSSCLFYTCDTLRDYAYFSYGKMPFQTGPGAKGFITFTEADTVTNRYAGTFDFVAQGNGGQQVRLSEGRFRFE